MPNDLAQKAIAQQLDRARRDLLDLGLRNSLLNYRTPKTRGVDIAQRASANVFTWLVKERRELPFMPLLDADGEEQSRGSSRHTAEPSDRPGLPASLTEKALQGRLLATYYAANAHIEERGANILFLAFGMLHWFEDDNSSKDLKAPLLLVPVTLQRTSARDKFKLSYTDEDLEDNLSLATKLKSDFLVKFPEIPDPEDLDVDAYFKAIAKAVRGQNRWRVEPDEISLGLFSFGKFLMYRDLEPQNWCSKENPDGTPTLAALLRDGFGTDAPVFSEDEYLDEHIAPDAMHQVVDIDSSQALALLDVRAGRHLVIQGPPGTGKSQTITNVLADALGQGKKVLFVAEKMAALEVVKRRLNKAGIGDACLELHSHSANKKSLLEDLKRTIGLGKPKLNGGRFSLDNYRVLRDELNNYCSAVNTPVGDSDYTPYQLYGELVEIRRALDGTELPRLKADGAPLKLLGRQEMARLATPISGLQSHLAVMGVPAKHPFRYSRLTSLLPSDRQDIEAALKELIAAAETVAGAMSSLSTYMGIEVSLNALDALVLVKAARRALKAPHLKDVRINTDDWQRKRDEVTELLITGERLTALYESYEPVLISEAWDADLLNAREVLRTTGQKWWRFVSGEYRRTRNRIAGLCKGDQPKDTVSQLRLVEAVMEAVRLRKMFDEHQQLGKELFGVQWQGTRSEWPVLKRINEWIVDLYRAIGANEVPKGIVHFLAGNPQLDGFTDKIIAVEQSLPIFSAALPHLAGRLALDSNAKVAFHSMNLNEQSEMARQWLVELALLPSQVTYNNLVEGLRKSELGWVVDVGYSWESAAQHLVHFFRHNVLEAWLRQAYAERDALRRFGTAPHEQVRSQFIELDRASFATTQLQLMHRHWESLPRGGGYGQLGILQREFEKRARHMPIRKMMVEAGNAIQAIKPIFMMSPMSVATFLPPGSVQFDLVVFDEASQVKPVDAFGAVLRGQQIVVVGDSKQLPPTSFFDSLAGEGDAEEAADEQPTSADIESILGLMAGQGAPQRMLRWHYRSRHQSLIALSNKEFYDSRLVVFPSPAEKQPGLGLVFHHLSDAPYDRGRSRTNRKEAHIVAKAVMKHARTSPHLTLGVAAFSLAQAEAILDEVEQMREADPTAEEFFSRHEFEPFFVKNLESVQGDERDVIFISVGYGKDESGYVSMNFGALNGSGGERRLNVLITRARLACEVFSNLTEADIDLARTPARGVAALKAYLKFAATGILDIPGTGDGDHDSPFEEEVAHALNQAGHQVRAQVGSGGFRLDLAVVDPEQPGRYLLGIECDGATYHSSRSARDRDRLRQQVLEGLGWKIHRIWSTDWFRNGDEELRRVLQAVEQARAWTPSVHTQTATTPVNRAEPLPRLVRTESPPPPSATVITAQPYVIADVSLRLGSLELHEVPVTTVGPLVQSITGIEGPIHVQQVMRRICDAAGVSRLGGRIETALFAGITYARRQEWVKVQGDFLWPPNGGELVIRDRSALPAASRKIELIAPEEVKAAIKTIVDGSFGINEDELTPAVARLFGFGRTSDDITVGIKKQLKAMIKQAELVIQDGHITMP